MSKSCLLGLLLQSQDVWSLDRQLSLVRSDNDWAPFQMFNFAELCSAFADSFKSRYWRTSRQALPWELWGNGQQMGEILHPAWPGGYQLTGHAPSCLLARKTLWNGSQSSHISLWDGCKEQLFQGEHLSLGDTGNSQNSNTVKMFEFSSLHFPLVVLFLFICGEIKSIMGNSKANRKHFSWVCLSWQHNNNCNNLTAALGVSENESSLHS